jgi:prepilin-type N-terminal cleavage/methylation domain-containing protein
MNKLKTKKGFSLIEVLVATALFAIITTATLDIFKLVIDSQRGAIATQNVEESLKYFLEVTAKEIRMARRNMLNCLSFSSLKIYSVTQVSANADDLFFVNYKGECVKYSLSNGRFAITRGNVTDYISPAKIVIDELHFVLEDETSTRQPAVTMELVAHALGKDSAKSQMRIQTTLTSRYYKTN